MQPRNPPLNPLATLLALAPAVHALMGRYKHPRNGKIARLPDPIRQHVNRMLADGFPYKLLIAKLLELHPELSSLKLNEMNISNWVNGGGYREWLQLQHEEAFLSRLPEAARARAQQILPQLRTPVLPFRPKYTRRPSNHGQASPATKAKKPTAAPDTISNQIKPIQASQLFRPEIAPLATGP